MTDAFEVTGEFAPAESLSHSDAHSLDATVALAGNEADVAVSDAPEAPEVPNGFVELGLAKELVAAVKDLSYTQPTTVQAQVIPKSLHGDSHRDLMVSSQTGSGKQPLSCCPSCMT